jgi:hypothetical protein
MAKPTDRVGLFGLVAVGGLAVAGGWWLWRERKFQTVAGGTRAAIATGRPELDRYDGPLAAAIDASGPMAVRNARLVKALAFHESAGFQPQYAEGVHTDGVSWGLMGLHRQYFSGDLADPAHNARLGVAYLMVQLANAGGDAELALSRYNAGPRSGVTAYASNVMAKLAQLYPGSLGGRMRGFGRLDAPQLSHADLVRHAWAHRLMDEQGITAATVPFLS